MTHELKIIKEGVIETFETEKLTDFRKKNSIAYPFGESAKSQGESPLKMKIEFVDGNVVGFRGDLKTPYVSIMAVNLSKLLRCYANKNLVKKATIYDNRENIINKVILLYENGKIINNLLPLYIQNYVLK